MDDSLLISYVQSYEELYNVKHGEYSSQTRRDAIWEEIGKRMKKPDKVCKERWTRLRDNHRKALNLRKIKGGSKMKSPKFEKELAFLIPYIFDEETRPIDPSNFVEVINYVDDEPNMECHDSIDHNNAMSDVAASSRSSSPVVVKSPRGSSPIFTKNLRKRNKSSEEPEFLQVKKKHFNLSVPYNHQMTASQEPLINFFINMGQTVKTFPLRDQIEIKSKLFQIVNSIEMRIATALDPK